MKKEAIERGTITQVQNKYLNHEALSFSNYSCFKGIKLQLEDCSVLNMV